MKFALNKSLYLRPCNNLSILTISTKTINPTEINAGVFQIT